MQKDIIKEAKKLSIAERMIIIEDIWDSVISSNEDLSVTEEQKTELDNRLADYYRNSTEGSTWNKVVERVRNKL